MEQLRSIKFPDYSNYTCVNDAYQDFVTNFLSVIDFLALVRALRVKSNTKSWFHIGLSNASQKQFKKSNEQAKRLTKTILNILNISLKKQLIISKNVILKKTLQKIRIIIKNCGEF